MANQLPSGNLGALPNEIMSMVLNKLLDSSQKNKNDALPLRLVCKRFEEIIRPKIFKTIQLDFDRLSKTGHPLNIEMLQGVGQLVKGLVADLAVIRTQSEIKDLRAAFSSITGRVTDTKHVLEKLNLHCMGNETFDEGDFKKILENIFQYTSSLQKVKLLLPFKIVGQVPTHATTLLANALACIASRDASHTDLDTLVIGHLSDTTLNKIYNNPIDLKNALTVFKSIRHLQLGMRRQEFDHKGQVDFKNVLWKLVTEAKQLRSLCFMGFNTNRLNRERAAQQNGRVDLEKWTAHSLPFTRLANVECFQHLTQLELKRVDISAPVLIDLLKDMGMHLTELYINQVHLKYDQGHQPRLPHLWLGIGPDGVKGASDIWIADEVFAMRNDGLLGRLKVLRATAIGYDYINPVAGAVNTFDLEDITGQGHSLDARFIARAMGMVLPIGGAALLPPTAVDVRATQLLHNPTSIYASTLDGVFNTFNSATLGEMSKIIGVVDNSMEQLTGQLESVNRAGDANAPSPDADGGDAEMTDADANEQDDDEEDDDDEDDVFT